LSFIPEVLQTAEAKRHFAEGFAKAKCGEALWSNTTELLAFVGGRKSKRYHSVLPLRRPFCFF
jgi:hypothetical protein